ncbi:MAG: mevalonate kinase [Candidatus Thorarchaeota archaeon]|nr:mevalonate kinase [Candidatus Thorarchaeota archaeon]
MSVGKGRGKSILFGEHFVVYGIPSLAAGIDAVTIAHVSRGKSLGWTLDDQRPAVPGYKEKKMDEQKESINNVLNFLDIDTSKNGIHIEYGGDLICASGFGASAASCVSLARALSEEFNLGLSDEKVNEAAYEGEKGYHGTPSGLDNTASTYGGLVWYIRDLEGGPPKFKPIKLKEPVNLVIASTGITASTTEVVGDVRAKKDANPEWFEKISKEYENLVHEALTSLENQDLVKVGQLMNRNHELLQDITVSCKELDDLVKIARDNGALGAKMTGTGRGGNMIAITVDESARDTVAKALEEGGAAFVIKTTFGA